MTDVRLGAISFINTLPVYLDFQQEKPEAERLPLVYGPPSWLNQAMLEGRLDVSPVSSAFYLRHKDRFTLLSDLSVSSPGSVDSVLFLSRQPLGKALLDHPVISVPDSSETSIALLAYFLQQATGQDLRQWFQVYPAADYRQTLAETGAILMIGDDALKMIDDGIPDGYHCYDLASLWAEETGFPFVFAVWVAQRELAEARPERLKAINTELVQSRIRFLGSEALLQEGIRIARTRCTISSGKLRSYFTRSLSYELTDAHRTALSRFETILESLDTPTSAHDNTSDSTRSKVPL